MKLSEYKKTYEDFSGKASNVVRQLSFAGIAVIWIFKVQSNGSLKIPDTLAPESRFVRVRKCK